MPAQAERTVGDTYDWYVPGGVMDHPCIDTCEDGGQESHAKLNAIKCSLEFPLRHGKLTSSLLLGKLKPHNLPRNEAPDGVYRRNDKREIEDLAEDQRELGAAVVLLQVEDHEAIGGRGEEPFGAKFEGLDRHGDKEVIVRHRDPSLVKEEVDDGHEIPNQKGHNAEDETSDRLRIDLEYLLGSEG